MSADTSNIILYRGWLDKGKHVWSPFVVKLEARLRFAGTSYQTEAGSVKTSPTGKIPYVEMRYGSDESPSYHSDSSLIIKELVDQDIIPDLNAKVPLEYKSHDLALRALLEDKLYFYHTQERWVWNYYTMRDHILGVVPYPVRVVVGYLIYRNTLKTLHGQGTGRFTRQQIAVFRQEIWENVNDILVSSRSKIADSSEPFWALGGRGPTEADATLFGFIVSVLICTACPDSQRVVKGFPVILDYASRIHDTYFPDYQKW